MSENQQSRIKDLINRGREQGYLTYDDVNDHLPEDISDPDQVEDIIQMINDMGIRVYETAPDADELLMQDTETNTDEIAAAEAAAALAAVETEVGRTTDPVRMYMREMARWSCLPARAKSPSRNVSKRACANSCTPWPTGLRPWPA